MHSSSETPNADVHVGHVWPTPPVSRVAWNEQPGNAPATLEIVQQLQVPAMLQARPQEAHSGKVTLSKMHATMIIDTDLKIIKHRLDKSMPTPILAEDYSIARRNM
jgi:hypothetical protein